MSTTESTALEHFDQGWNCAQAVLGAFQPGTGLPLATLRTIAASFGGGMARKQEVCGAVTGAAMAIGLHYPHLADDPARQRETIYPLGAQVMEQFAASVGSVRCRELLNGCDLASPEGQARFKAEGLRESVCKRCIAQAVKLCAAALEQQAENQGS